MRISIDSPLLDLIVEAQAERVKKENWKHERIRGEIARFSTEIRGLLTWCDRVWVPDFSGIRQSVMEEVHKFRFSIHPGDTKMYRDLRLIYWCPCMKREITWYVERCLTYRMVKAEHQRPYDKLQPLEVPMRK